MSLFKLRGALTKTQELTLGIIGIAIFLLAWWAVAEMNSTYKAVANTSSELPSTLGADSLANQILVDSILLADSIAVANATEHTKIYPLIPPPQVVAKSFPSLFSDDDVFTQALSSVWSNIQGYFWAVLISLLFGGLIGLIPLFRGLFSKHVEAARYLPLTALTGVFILWFGIDEPMKVAFLAFGIIVFMLPVVVQRIDEVEDVYLKTVFTLGATDWQTIRTVYIPAVMSKFMDDIRVLTAIGWTYIIIAEFINRTSGLGSLIAIKARQGQLEKVFAILLVIILIGFIQDRLFVFIDKKMFPHKYVKTVEAGMIESRYGIFTILGSVLLLLLIGALIPSLTGTLQTIVGLLVVTSLLLIGYGEFRTFSSKRQNG